MTVNITSKQMDITPALRQYIEERFIKLNKWQANLINYHIILSKEPKSFIVDATITMPHGSLVASAKDNDMYNAVNLLITKLARQLNKIRHKAEARRAAACLKKTPLPSAEVS